MRIEETDLPLPFYDDGWTGVQREAAHAFWHWHLALTSPMSATHDAPGFGAFFEEEKRRAAAGQPVCVIPGAVADAAYAACSAYDLPLEHLAAQVGAAGAFAGPLRFAEGGDVLHFIAQWVVPHGRLLAGLAGKTRSWQLPLVDELCRAFFLTGRLAALPEDLTRDHLFIPEADLGQMGVSFTQLRAGEVDENVRRLLWKQVVRARDAFAQGQPFARELDGRPARAFKRAWHGALELLNEIERRDYDLWSAPLSLSAFQRVLVRYQALFGRAAFRS